MSLWLTRKLRKDEFSRCVLRTKKGAQGAPYILTAEGGCSTFCLLNSFAGQEPENQE
jgi:hypothetical protein